MRTARLIDPHEKVAREANPASRNAYPSGDLAVDDGERDGNPEFARKHVGKEAVSRVIVVALVAAKAERFVDVLSEPQRLLEGALLLEAQTKERSRHLVEVGEERGGFEVGIRVLRDERCAERDIHLRVRLVRELLKGRDGHPRKRAHQEPPTQAS